MKILHVIDSGGLYGAEIMLLNLARRQVTLGISPVILSMGGLSAANKPLETEAENRNIKVVRFRMRGGPNLSAALKICRLAHREGIDIIHSHGYKANILLGFVPKKVRRVPIVSTVHGWTSVSKVSKMRLYDSIDRISLRFMNAVVLVSDSMRTKVGLEGLKSTRVYVIENGIPSDVGTCRTNGCGGLEADLDQEVVTFCSKSKIIGSIGRLSEEKGHIYLIEAFFKLNERGCGDFRLVIIGEGPSRRILESRVKEMGLVDKVLLPGYKTNGADYLHLFDVFALPSLTEGMPITLLEAMRASTPIVASRVGGVAQLLEEGSVGLLVESRDVLGLSEAILKILTDRVYADSLAERGRFSVVGRYSDSAMADKYSEVYKNVLEFSRDF